MEALGKNNMEKLNLNYNFLKIIICGKKSNFF